jgi:hypothetical protein
MLRRVALAITDVSEELSASFIRVTRIGELGKTLATLLDRRSRSRSFYTNLSIGYKVTMFGELGTTTAVTSN